MLRECTEAENRILKESKADVLTLPELYAFANRKGVLPIIVGLFAGLVLGTVLALIVPVKEPVVISSLLFIGIILSLIVTELAWDRHGIRKSKNVDLPGEKFRVNGGVILDYSGIVNEAACLAIAEDDLKDRLGNPVIIQYPAPHGLNVTLGERILIAYSDNGAYIPLRLTARTERMIPSNPPEYFRNVDWVNAVKLPHPAVMDLDNTGVRMNEKDTSEFAKKCNSIKNIKVKNWVGIILMSILILFLLFIAFIFLVGNEVVTEPGAILAAAGALLLIWLILSFLFAKAVLSGSTRGLKKIQYKKKVMFLKIHTEAGFNGAPMSYIQVFENVNGTFMTTNHLVSNNVFLPKDIPYGRVICKYSKEADSKERGLNYFCEL